MILKRVTFTAVDQWTDLARMESLTEQYPFVEWAFLLSKSKSGVDPRYPTIAFLDKLRLTSFSNAVSTQFRTAVHLCGSLARNVVTPRRYSTEVAVELVPGAQRIQINLGAAVDDDPDLYLELGVKAYALNRSIIIQVPSFNCTTCLSSLDDECQRLSFLFDQSGGTGFTSPFQRPPSDSFVGFAGGITPDNVVDRLHEIANLDIRAIRISLLIHRFHRVPLRCLPMWKGEL